MQDERRHTNCPQCGATLWPVAVTMLGNQEWRLYVCPTHALVIVSDGRTTNTYSVEMLANWPLRTEQPPASSAGGGDGDGR